MSEEVYHSAKADMASEGLRRRVKESGGANDDERKVEYIKAAGEHAPEMLRPYIHKAAPFIITTWKGIVSIRPPPQT